MKWFVYSDATYYPSAGIVEADTAAEAVVGYYSDRPQTGWVVVPAAAVELIPAEWSSVDEMVRDLEDDGEAP